MSRRLLVALLAVAMPLAVATAALAHSTVDGTNGLVTYVTEDVTSANCLKVTDQGTDIVFDDKCVDFGMSATGACHPGGNVDTNGYYYQARCTKQGTKEVHIDVGAREDKVDYSSTTPGQVLLGDGADTAVINNSVPMFIDGGPGGDNITAGTGQTTIIGGSGDNTITGGPGGGVIDVTKPGSNTVKGGSGPTTIKSRNGYVDHIDCGGGHSTALVDQFDTTVNCEKVEVANVAKGSNKPSFADKTPPKVASGALSRQHVKRRKSFFVAVTSSQKGSVSASGRLVVNGIFVPLRGPTVPVDVAGGGVEVRIKLDRNVMRELRKAWRKHKRPYVLVDVVATNEAGVSTTAKAPRVYLAP